MTMPEGSINAATDAIASMLGEGQKDESAQDTSNEPTETAETSQATEEVETEETAPQESDAPQDAKEEDDGTVVVRVNDQEYRVPKELEGHLLREADYTRKTQEVARQRKEIETERQTMQEKIAAQYQAERDELKRMLAHAVNDDSQVDWVKLAQEDPQEYLIRKEQAEQRRSKFEQLAKQDQEAQARRLQALIQSETEKLQAKLPDWKDEKKAAEAKLNITKYLQAEGFTSDEIGSVYDHRLLVMAEKARQFDALKKSNIAAKKIEKMPPRVEKPGAAEQNKSGPAKSALLRLKSTGRVDDAAAAISQMFN